MSSHHKSRIEIFVHRLAVLLFCGWIGGPAAAGIAVYAEPEALSRNAPIVVEGQVIRTASGFDPRTGRLNSYVTLRVTLVHRGPADLDRLMLRELGGRYGSLVHDVDSVPVYRVGERVLAFLEFAPDGALRTSGMFFGKFELSSDDADIAWARRELDGQGRILRRPVANDERFPLRDLRAVVAGVAYEGRRGRSGRTARARGRLSPLPPEHDHLLWDDVDELEPHSGVTAPFVALGNPTRWFEADSGQPVKIHVDPDGAPLPGAVTEIQRAIDAWTAVPEARLALQLGNTDFEFADSESPAVAYTGTNIVLFDDPYDDIADPTNCSGVLAIGGYWRTGSIAGTINGVGFHRALQLYVIFNDNFGCVLSDPDNLAEVATHELGHAIGFGHSTTHDSIMRSSAYLARGPRLGDDDRDAAHCFYPHTLTLESPDGGENLTSGASQPISWSSSAEAGPDPGEVSIEHSTDGGSTWSTVADKEVNDGHYGWLVPTTVGYTNRVRIARHLRAGAAPWPFPTTCSRDASNADFRIEVPAIFAGSVPDGSVGAGALLASDVGFGHIELRWGPSCSADADDYAVYEGSLSALRGGVWDHRSVTCSTAGARNRYLPMPAEDRYYLVSARAGQSEGPLGRSSTGTLRPVPTTVCGVPESAPVCE